MLNVLCRNHKVVVVGRTVHGRERAIDRVPERVIDWFKSWSPSPFPSPKERGSLFGRVCIMQTLRIATSAGNGAPSPMGEGRGEGKEVLKTPKSQE